MGKGVPDRSQPYEACVAGREIAHAPEPVAHRIAVGNEVASYQLE